MINDFECPNVSNSLDDFFNKISENKALPTNTYSLKEFVVEVSSEENDGDVTITLKLPRWINMDYSTLDKFAREGVIITFTINTDYEGNKLIDIIVKNEFDLSILL